ncbi:RNA polymerase sigma factor [Hephaestia sp. GCM10023244]|uniref:RNA polymerase sigma factor n=1 Tax=unclassified Hephaestia TaxID=2631281 RepID=UPI002076F3FC|nr:RNA polymerase sigma factor [Hephaestia sp. MAHUQ-44]MCM8730780.1 RNA polymerase sigma factor [Hephaestia sp. MAHUQ-44]
MTIAHHAPATPRPDDDLLRRARAGDRDAFSTIMTRGNQRLFRIARSVVGNDSEAEDVLQESYLRAFRAIGGFRGDADVMTWLTRIVVNEARGRLRKRRPTVGLEQIERAQEAGAAIIAFPTPPGFASPEAAAESAHLRRMIEAAIDELSEPFRLVFILRDVNGRSIEETADALGIPAATVKTRLHRARRQMRAAIDDRLRATIAEAFSFLGPACARITATVLARLDEQEVGVER